MLSIHFLLATAYCISYKFMMGQGWYIWWMIWGWSEVNRRWCKCSWWSWVPQLGTPNRSPWHQGRLESDLLSENLACRFVKTARCKPLQWCISRKCVKGQQRCKQKKMLDTMSDTQQYFGLEMFWGAPAVLPCDFWTSSGKSAKKLAAERWKAAGFHMAVIARNHFNMLQTSPKKWGCTQQHLGAEKWCPIPLFHGFLEEMGDIFTHVWDAPLWCRLEVMDPMVMLRSTRAQTKRHGAVYLSTAETFLMCPVVAWRCWRFKYVLTLVRCVSYIYIYR